ncbi:MAG TPA: tetratricopeptide repeat protein [Pyrinomonadaceae bacterium]
MKKFAVVSFLALASAGCGNSVQPVNAPPASNTNNTLTVSSRSQNSAPAPQTNTTLPAAPKSGEKSKWTQSGNPIDTTEFDAEIKQAEKNLKAKPNDAAKNALSESYFKRGVALTDARQYASALGDYRRALKLNPGNADAKKWIDQIIEIYDGLNKAYPKEGEEPPPLPFSKQT